MRESVIEDHLVKRVKELGGEVRKVTWPGRRGAPDRLVMLPERLPSIGQIRALQLESDRPATVCRDLLTQAPQAIWVELKAPGKAPEPHQEREHQRMRAMGQRVEVIDSIEGVEELLQ